MNKVPSYSIGHEQRRRWWRTKEKRKSAKHKHNENSSFKTCFCARFFFRKLRFVLSKCNTLCAFQITSVTIIPGKSTINTLCALCMRKQLRASTNCRKRAMQEESGRVFWRLNTHRQQHHSTARANIIALKTVLYIIFQSKLTIICLVWFPSKRLSLCFFSFASSFRWCTNGISLVANISCLNTNLVHSYFAL